MAGDTTLSHSSPILAQALEQACDINDPVSGLNLPIFIYGGDSNRLKKGIEAAIKDRQSPEERKTTIGNKIYYRNGFEGLRNEFTWQITHAIESAPSHHLVSPKISDDPRRASATVA
jgi:hypothetical protein